MPRYLYTAIDVATGKERTGELDRMDAETAVGELKMHGLFPTALAPAKETADAGLEKVPMKFVRSPVGRWFRRWHRAAGAKELTIFMRQLSALVSAGMPLVRSLDLLARQERNPAWQAIIVSLADVLRSGGTLSDG